MRPGRYKTQAIVLRKVNYQEADLIVTFLSREFGKMGGLAKHARKSRKRFANVFGSFAVVELEFTHKQGRDLALLENGDLVLDFGSIGQDMVLLALASNALELTEAFSAELDVDERVFDLAVWVLGRLAQADRPREALLFFGLKLLDLAGYGPNFTVCANCGRAIDPGGRGLSLRPDLGGPVCGCLGQGPAVDLGALRLAGLVAGLGLERLDRVRAGQGALAQLEPFIEEYAARVLGRELKTARFMRQVRAEKQRQGE